MPAPTRRPQTPPGNPTGTPPRPDAGFTLLELLVVLTILVLLTVSVGTVALNYLGGARADAALLQRGQIEAGLDLFRLDVGRYPTTQEGLGALITRPSDGTRWNGPYLRNAEALADPWGAPFRYAAPGEGAPFDLYSLGADGVEGGEDENADIGR